MLIIDSNQASMDQNLRIHLEKQTDVIVSPLDTADLMFIGKMKGEQVKVGIELKKAPSDLMGSLRDGRLMTQLPRLTQEYDMAYLYLIGDHTKSLGRHIFFAEILTLPHSVQNLFLIKQYLLLIYLLYYLMTPFCQKVSNSLFLYFLAVFCLLHGLPIEIYKL